MLDPSDVYNILLENPLPIYQALVNMKSKQMRVALLINSPGFIVRIEMFCLCGLSLKIYHILSSNTVFYLEVEQIFMHRSTSSFIFIHYTFIPAKIFVYNAKDIILYTFFYLT